MNKENFWHLLSLKLSGEASDEELEAYDLHLQNNPELNLQAQLFIQLWKKNPEAQINTDDFFNKHLQRLSNRPDIYSPNNEDNPVEKNAPALKNFNLQRRQVFYYSGIAAAIILVVFFIFYPTPKNNKQEPVAQNTVSTRKGSKSNIQLPDGTIAWLNADSKLVYDENFRGDTREVYLQGEAFFDVVKDKTKPFIIHTKSIDIKVLGTAFNVRAYDNEKNTETSLFRGSVEVTLRNRPEKKIVLSPNEKLLVNNKSLLLENNANAKEKIQEKPVADITLGKVHFEKRDSSALETLWIKNKLVFDAETLEEVARNIERWYNVKVIINGNQDLKQTAFSAVFENESLRQVMEALKITGNFRYSINKDTVTTVTIK